MLAKKKDGLCDLVLEPNLSWNHNVSSHLTLRRYEPAFNILSGTGDLGEGLLGSYEKRLV